MSKWETPLTIPEKSPIKTMYIKMVKEIIESEERNDEKD